MEGTGAGDAWNEPGADDRIAPSMIRSIIASSFGVGGGSIRARTIRASRARCSRRLLVM
jgi:hypothetical protein